MSDVKHEDEPRSVVGVYRLVMEHRDQSEDAHHRLRETCRSLETRMSALESEKYAALSRLQKLESQSTQPTEVSELRFTPQMVIAICAAVASIIGGSYAVNAGQRQDIKDIGSQLVTQTKLYDERMAALKSAIDDVNKRQQLQQIEFQSLKETVITKGTHR